MNLSGPGVFLVGRLLVAASNSDLVIGLLRDSASFWFSLGGCKCPGIYPFLLDLLVYVQRSVIVISDGSLYFCGIGVDILFIIFLLHLFDSSLFSF